MASAICSAPSRPIRARRSESFVKPETSANTSVPGMHGGRGLGRDGEPAQHDPRHVGDDPPGQLRLAVDRAHRREHYAPCTAVSAVLARPDQTRLVGEDDRLHAVAQPELAQQVRDVRLHRRLGRRRARRRSPRSTGRRR